MKTNQKGFAHITAIILAVVIVGVVAGGYVLYSKNKVTDPEPVAETAQSATDNKQPATTPQDNEAEANIATLPELGISFNLLTGWAIRNDDSTDVGYLIYNEGKNLTISASISTSPVGFSVCESQDEFILAKVTTLQKTAVDNLFILGVDGNGPVLASSSLALGTKSKELNGESIILKDATAGSEFYYCPNAQPPYGWSVNFDNNAGTNDEVRVGILKPADMDKKAIDYPEYAEIVSILSTVKKL